MISVKDGVISYSGVDLQEAILQDAIDITEIVAIYVKDALRLPVLLDYIANIKPHKAKAGRYRFRIKDNILSLINDSSEEVRLAYSKDTNIEEFVGVEVVIMTGRGLMSQLDNLNELRIKKLRNVVPLKLYPIPSYHSLSHIIMYDLGEGKKGYFHDYCDDAYYQSYFNVFNSTQEVNLASQEADGLIWFEASDYLAITNTILQGLKLAEIHEEVIEDIMDRLALNFGSKAPEKVHSELREGAISLIADESILNIKVSSDSTVKDFIIDTIVRGN